MWMFLMFLSATASSTAAQSCEDLSSLPSYREVSVALQKRRAVDELTMSRQRWRVRNSLPNLDVSFGSDVDENFRWATNRATTEVQGREFGFRVRARWNLSSLILDTNELRWLREKRMQDLLWNQRVEKELERYRKLRELLVLPRTPLRGAKIAFFCERLDLETNGLFLGGN